ncbi:MAG: hypothetical protein JW768_09445 [Chitinispirillaceae bacterium]|nr:hypothetical protein [Chitinispirillaceae bacterium]
MKRNHRNIIGFIPIAGRGGSMQPLTSFIPKCLLYAGQKTLLEHALINILILKPEVVYFILSDNPMWHMVHDHLRKIKAQLKTSTKFKLIIAHHGKHNTGSILKTFPEVKNRTCQIVTIFPDVYLVSKEHILNLYDSHREKLKNLRSYIGTILGSHFLRINEGVIVEKNGLIQKYVEKPPMHSDLLNTAIGVFEPSIVDFVSKKGDGLFSHIVPSALASKKRIGVYLINDKESWYHLRTAADLHTLHYKLLDKMMKRNRKNISSRDADIAAQSAVTITHI